MPVEPEPEQALSFGEMDRHGWSTPMEEEMVWSPPDGEVQPL